MHFYTSKFGNTKNLPQNHLSQKEATVTPLKDPVIQQKAFGQVYCPPEQFDFMSLMQNKEVKYPLSLNKNIIFPRNEEKIFQVQQSDRQQLKNMRDSNGKYIMFQKIDQKDLFLFKNSDETLVQRKEQSSEQQYSQQDTKN